MEAEGHASLPPQEALHGAAPEGSGFEIVLQARPSLLHASTSASRLQPGVNASGEASLL